MLLREQGRRNQKLELRGIVWYKLLDEDEQEGIHMDRGIYGEMGGVWTE